MVFILDCIFECVCLDYIHLPVGHFFTWNLQYLTDRLLFYSNHAWKLCSFAGCRGHFSTISRVSDLIGHLATLNLCFQAQELTECRLPAPHQGAAPDPVFHRVQPCTFNNLSGPHPPSSQRTETCFGIFLHFLRLSKCPVNGSCQ